MLIFALLILNQAISQVVNIGTTDTLSVNKLGNIGDERSAAAPETACAILLIFIGYTIPTESSLLLPVPT